MNKTNQRNQINPSRQSPLSYPGASGSLFLPVILKENPYSVKPFYRLRGPITLKDA